MACQTCYARLMRRQMAGQPLDPERFGRIVKPKPPKKRVGRFWPPCAVCGDPDGGKPRICRTPSRYNLKRFGVTGFGCQRCYVRLKYREQNGLVVDPHAVLRRRAHDHALPMVSRNGTAAAESAQGDV
jgi:hypothetical protein